MKRVSWLMAVAGVLIWGAALINFGRRPAAMPRNRHPSVMSPQNVSSEPQDSVPQPSPGLRRLGEPPPTTPSSAATRPSAAPAIATQTPTRSPGSPSASLALLPQGARAVAAIGRVTQVPVTPAATGELGEGVLSPEYMELERQYGQEPRDGSLAGAVEGRISGMLEATPLKDKVALVHCQSSICRIELEGASEQAFAQLLAVPGLAEATGLGPQTPFSLRTGQLSVYFRRPEAEPSSR